METLLVMCVAALLTVAACSGAGSKIGISAKLGDDQKAEDLAVWEVFRVFYRAVLGALQNTDVNTGWPTPNLSVAPLLNGVDLSKMLATATPLLAGLGLTPVAVTTLLSKLVPAVTAPAATTTPLPDPGAPAATVTTTTATK